MPDFANQQIQPPKNWQDFEDLCADLWKKIWCYPNTQKNGRQGQSQNGVDIFGRLNGDGGWRGVQCKGKDGRFGAELSKTELQKEVDKAKNFSPKLSHFILATTAPNDQKIQEAARKITEGHSKVGLFTVDVLGWDEIHRQLSDHEDLIEKHYPQLAPKTQKLLNSIEDIAANHLRPDEHAALHKQTQEGIKAVKERLDTLISASVDTVPREELDANLHAEIDNYRSILQEHAPQKAIDQLEKLKIRVWGTARARIKYRICALIALAKMELGEIESAVQSFLESETFAPEDENAGCNVVVAYLLQEENDKALAKAKEVVKLHPTYSRAHSLLVVASHNDLTVTDPTALIPAEQHESAEVAFAISRFFRKRGDSDKAREWMLRANTLDDQIFEIRVGWAEELIHRHFQDEAVAVGQLPNDAQKEDLRTARGILSQIWEELKETEVVEKYFSVALNLSHAERLLGDRQQALKTLDDALQTCTDEPHLLRQKAILEFEAGDIDQAVSAASRVSDSEYPDQALLHAEILRKANRSTEALDRIDGFLVNAPDSEGREVAAVIRIHILRDTIDVAAAAAEGERLLKENPTSIRFSVATSELLDAAGDRKGAVRRVAEAKRLLNEESGFVAKTLVADQLYSLEQYEEARNIYESIIVTNQDSLSLRNYLICLYESDHRRLGLEILTLLPPEIREQPFFTKMEAAIHIRVGNLFEARRGLESYLKVLPNELHIFLNLVGVLNRLGEKDKIEELLSGPLKFPDALPTEWAQLAQLLEMFGKTDRAHEIAYENRRSNKGSPDAHLGFISLFIMGTSSDILDQKEVAVDSAFVLEGDHGEQKTFIVEIRPDADLGAREILPDHPVAVAALGKKSGDLVSIPNPIQTNEHRITAIKHKYIHALHDSINNYNTNFPNDNRLIQVLLGRDGSPEDNLAPLLSAITDRRDLILELEEIYRTQNIPLGIIAKLVGSNPIDVFTGLVAGDRVKLKSCIGTDQERQQAGHLIETEKVGFVVDPVTLYTIFVLGIQEAVSAVLGKLGIAQSSFDVFESLQKEREFSRGRKAITVAREDDRFVREEISDEALNQSIQQIGELVAWAKLNCVVLPAIPKEEVSFQGREIGQRMDASFFDTLLAASGSDRKILCDDIGLRNVASMVLGVKGTWLQPVLMMAESKGLIKREVYNQAIVNLIKLNFSFTTFDHHVLLYSARENKWETTGNFARIADELGGQNADLSSNAVVAVAFLAEIWQRGRLSLECRQNFTYRVINGLLRERWGDTATVLRIFLKMAIPICGWNPQRRQAFLFTLDQWCVGHFTRLPVS